MFQNPLGNGIDMVTRKDGLMVDHIPFPIPKVRPALRQGWKKLTFLHWEVEPDILRTHLPDDLELDLHEGKAYVGCIPFVFTASIDKKNFTIITGIIIYSVM